MKRFRPIPALLCWAIGYLAALLAPMALLLWLLIAGVSCDPLLAYLLTLFPTALWARLLPMIFFPTTH